MGNNETWKRAIEWIEADFGFQRCPIFVAQIDRGRAKRKNRLFQLLVLDDRRLHNPCNQSKRKPKGQIKTEFLSPTENIVW